ncbi:YcaO-like family protein [Nocardia uniformis]|uniref:YcaO-like family protein n=1 Tax=Nocardia uniformis TaxID=53432 RepID=A0A849C6Z3_9NOCA|nr:YcaO-like family protein [Nocardia uniformis]
MHKTYFRGTHRVRHPEATWAAIAPHIHEYGISRLANVTDLDIVGIPVYMAVRPMARTLTVAQGKGADPLAAKVSAAMEAIEMWHAEHAVPDATATAVPATELHLPYRVSDLATTVRGIGTDSMVLDWIPATDFSRDLSTYVPRSAVVMDWRPPPRWTPLALPSTSNGLASGNTRAEACIHAMLEVIERDCTAQLSLIPQRERTRINPATVTDPTVVDLIGKLRAAGAWFELVIAATQWPVWCFACYLWLPDAPVIAAGSGAHTDPGVALSRAITEAAQSRLTTIVGTRDDINPKSYTRSAAPLHPPEDPDDQSTLLSWQTMIDSGPVHRFNDDHTEAAWLAALIADNSGHSPLIVDLADGSDFAVVKVLCPNLQFRTRHQIPRPGAA